MSSAYKLAVLVAGTDVVSKVGIISLDCCNGVNQIPQLHLRIKDGDLAKEKFTIADGSMFEPGKKIEIKADFFPKPKMKTIFKGIITGTAIGADGQTFMDITAHGDAIKLAQAPQTQWIKEKKSDKEVIEALMKLANITKGDVADSKIKHPQFFSHEQTIWRAMMARILTNGFVFAPDVIKGKNHVLNPADYKGKSHPIDLTGNGIRSFYLGNDNSSHIKTVKAKGWDIKKQDYHPLSTAKPGKEKAFAKADKVLSLAELMMLQSAPVPAVELQALANAQKIYRNLDMYQGKFTFVSTVDNKLADIKLMDKLKLSGFGKAFSDEYAVSEISHRFDNMDWLVDITLGLPLTKTLESGWRKAPPVPNLIGTVAKFKADPESFERIPVLLPTATGLKEIWARLLTPFASEEEGLHLVPKVKDEVIVGFIGGDSRYPVILGSTHNPKKKPPKPYDDKNEIQGLFMGKKGERMMLIENSKDKLSQLTSGEKASVTLSDKKGVVSAKKDKSTVTVGDDLLFDSKGKTGFKSSKDVDIESDGNINLKATKVEVS